MKNVKNCHQKSPSQSSFMIGSIHKGCPHIEGGRDGVSNKVDKSRRVEGGGLAVGGHPFQCGLCKREEGI